MTDILKQAMNKLSEPTTTAVDHFDNAPNTEFTNRIYPPVEIGTKLYASPQPAQSTQAEVTDEQIESEFQQCGGKWNGDQWVIEDADLHPFYRAILALRPAAVPMTGEQWTDVLGSAGPDLLDLAKQWSDNEVHVYQFVNEAEKIVKSAVLRGITAQAKKETP